MANSYGGNTTSNSDNAFKRSLHARKVETGIMHDTQHKEGYVYLLSIGELFKIGSTRNIKQRLDTHRRKYPDEVKSVYICFVQDRVSVERELQKMIWHKKVSIKSPEWFSKVGTTAINKLIKHTLQYGERYNGWTKWPYY